MDPCNCTPVLNCFLRRVPSWLPQRKEDAVSEACGNIAGEVSPRTGNGSTHGADQACYRQGRNCKVCEVWRVTAAAAAGPTSAAPRARLGRASCHVVRNVSVAELRAALLAVLVAELRLSLLGVLVVELRLPLLAVLVAELRLSLLAALAVELRLSLLAGLVVELRLSLLAVLVAELRLSLLVVLVVELRLSLLALLVVELRLSLLVAMGVVMGAALWCSAAWPAMSRIAVLVVVAASLSWVRRAGVGPPGPPRRCGRAALPPGSRISVLIALMGAPLWRRVVRPAMSRALEVGVFGGAPLKRSAAKSAACEPLGRSAARRTVWKTWDSVSTDVTSLL
jgi:hypothetical protein